MKKKIYAVKNGRVPGIYMKWLEAYEQIREFSNSDVKSFTYIEEYKNEDESDPRSLAYAMKQAKLYLGWEEEVIDEDSVEDLKDEDSSYVEDEDFEEFNDYDEDYDEFDNYDEDDEELPFDNCEEELPFGDDDDDYETRMYDGEQILERQKQDAINDTIYNMLEMENPRNGNSPWLEFLLRANGKDAPFVSNGTYTGRYSATSLYVGILYWILDTDEMWNKILLLNANYLMSKEQICRAFERSEEYKTLSRRLALLSQMDLSEIRYRNADLANLQAKSRLVSPIETYVEMKAFIKAGNRTLVDVYDELINNTIYRRELQNVTGPYYNPFLKELEPESELTTSMQELVMHASAIGIELKQAVIGQDEAINKLETSFFHTEKRANISSKRKGPRNVYLFAGPPGVGKTYTAKLFAENLGLPFKRFDMAGYASENSVEEVAGISNFWKDSKPGVLTEFVRVNPKCVLLFDEIEKAGKAVIRLFLQVLDEGQCFDRYYDKNIDFRDVIMIFTTNVGKQLYQEETKENLTLLSDQVIIDALIKDANPNTEEPYFPPEIVSRLSSHTIVMFNNLQADAIRRVVSKDVCKQLEATEAKYGFNLKEGSDFLAATIQFSASSSADARNATKLAGKVIDRELYDFLALVEEKRGLEDSRALKQIQWDFDFSDATDEIKQFYMGEKDAVIAVFGTEVPISCKEFEENHVEVKFTLDEEDFLNILHKENVLFALINYEYGLKQEESGLSIADIATVGHCLYEKVKEEDDELSVYVLCNENGYHYSAREKQELCNEGIIAFVEQERLQSEILRIYFDECCKKTMETLRLRHQVLTYETRNEISVKQELGRIVFYNFKLETAVDAEDKSTLLSDDLRPDKKWSDIYVSDDVKNELTYFIDYMKNPNAYVKKGVRVPKGVLMYGPPGTGKTSLAKVVAAESKVNFLSASADELIQNGSAYVHHQFRVARKYAPAIFFIDEIDAIGYNRGSNGVNSALNALLTEMDGFKKLDNKPVFIMAATNLGSEIDPALVRRFDRTFFVDLPDVDGRKWMLQKLIQKHSSLFDVSEDEIMSIANRSAGMSLAALENVIETALRDAIRVDRPVDDSMLDEVFEKCLLGEAKDDVSIEKVRNTAYHEAGHALIYMYYGAKPNYMSVVARGNFGGYVLNTEKESMPSKDKLLQRICAALGGRAAEMEFGYGITPGASADLQTATSIATRMVCELGMYEEEVGLAVIAAEQLANEPVAKKQINKILSEQLAQARSIVREKKEVIENLVTAVLRSEQKYLTQKELLNIYQGKVGEE